MPTKSTTERNFQKGINYQLCTKLLKGTKSKLTEEKNLNRPILKKLI